MCVEVLGGWDGGEVVFGRVLNPADAGTEVGGG